MSPSRSANIPGLPTDPAIRRGQRRLALVASAAFAVVLGAVMTGVTQELDSATVGRLRPDDQWGPAQARFNWVIDGLDPGRAYVMLGLVAAAVCLRRRSWIPAVFAGLVAIVSAGATIAVKLVTERPDPHGDIASTGGSFPSGHVAALLVCLGCCALLLFRRTRWWHWVLVAIPPTVMATALVYAAAHWVTDVVAGVLLGIATLGWAATWSLRGIPNLGVSDPHSSSRE